MNVLVHVHFDCFTCSRQKRCGLPQKRLNVLCDAFLPKCHERPVELIEKKFEHNGNLVSGKYECVVCKAIHEVQELPDD